MQINSEMVQANGKGVREMDNIALVLQSWQWKI